MVGYWVGVSSRWVGDSMGVRSLVVVFLILSIPSAVFVCSKPTFGPALIESVELNHSA